MRQQAHARTVLGKPVGRPTLPGGHAIDWRELHRHECLSGREQVAIVGVLREQMIDDRQQGLLARMLEGGAGHRGIDAGILGEAVEFVEGQHVIEECAHTVLEPGACQQAFHRVVQTRLAVQFAPAGRRQQRRVRWRVPQQEAEPGGQRIGIETRLARPPRIGLGLLDDEQEFRADENRLEGQG